MPLADFNRVLAALRERNEPVPRPPRLPSLQEVRAFERELGVHFHPDYRQFLLTASDVVSGTIEPATITDPAAHTYLGYVFESARRYGVPDNLFPFCEDNADFYCLADDGQVVYWSHDGMHGGSWASLAEWIESVWLEGRA